MFGARNNNLSPEDDKWKSLIKQATPFTFFFNSTFTPQRICLEIQALQKLSDEELNQIANDIRTSDLKLQMIANVPSLLARLDSKALAALSSKFVAVAEFLIAHPEKLADRDDVRQTITQSFPWLLR